VAALSFRSELVLEVVQRRADSFVVGQGRQGELGDDQSNARGVRELKYFAGAGATPLRCRSR
jgi:hypothetical protein